MSADKKKVRAHVEQLARESTSDDRLRIDEAEMYARYAEEIANELFEDQSEAKVAAVVALLEKSGAIMRRLIQADRIKIQREGERPHA